jgi:hypothetical protein
VSPDEYTATFVDALTAESVMLRSGATVITTHRDALRIPRIDSDPSAAFVSEAGTITPTDAG